MTPAARLRCIFASAVLVSALLGAQAGAEDSAITAGESIYRFGKLASGGPIIAGREPDLKLEGSDAACVNCHRRSGLGMKEGRIVMPPISGIYLYHPRAKDVDDLDLPFVEGMRPDRDPYTDETLAHAIRDGIGVDGQALNYLMPRYALGDADMAALIAYLKNLTRLPVPGVGDSLLHFATIITPDADPVKRKGMLDVLNHFFADKNAFARAESPRMRSSHRMMFKANRRWQLHVWELTGAPDTWEKQLAQYLAREPVFAVISGIGGATWAPVHHFCEQAALPCLFPNVDLPVVAEHDFYSLYFSQGVLLEAHLAARWLADAKIVPANGRVVQIYRTQDIGEAAAKATTQAGPFEGFQIVNHALHAGASRRELESALRDAGPHDVLLLWLRAEDLASLSNVPVRASAVLMSGIMGGLDKAPVPSQWRGVSHLIYPFDLPDLRRIRMDYPLGWFTIRHIPVLDERVQADTYLACGLVAETLSHMADSFIRDYLVERIEGMLEHRILTAYYPRLALAANQRFASKGGYIVHFSSGQGTRLSADSAWITP